jgi:tRNA(adenine34) deaminase
MKERDLSWMNIALAEADKAFAEDEIPVGALLIKDNEIIAKNHNRTRQLNDPSAHAEKLIIEECIKQNRKYLTDCTLYVTLEPCSMCAGLMVLVRLGRLVFGAHDPKTGAVGSLYNIPLDRQLNHNIEILQGLLAEESSRLLKTFFKNKR